MQLFLCFRQQRHRDKLPWSTRLQKLDEATEFVSDALGGSETAGLVTPPWVVAARLLGGWLMGLFIDFCETGG